jgi:hypothetical protein
VCFTSVILSKAQCFNRYGDTLGRFALYDEVRKKWEIVCYDTTYAFLGMGIKDERQFFDSLGVIPFGKALGLACKKGFFVEYAMLSENKREWILETKPGKRKYGHGGPGDFKELTMVMRVNARTGRIKYFRKEWVKNPTFF